MRQNATACGGNQPRPPEDMWMGDRLMPDPDSSPISTDRPPAHVPELDELEHRVWRAFLVTHARVARRLEADLPEKGGLSLAEFDVLFQLANADGQRLRMNELADRIVLSRAGITRLVDRLVADGLVSRLKCASDARGSYAVLTEVGRTRLDKVRPDHFAGVRRYFLEAFAAAEMQTLAALLERVEPIGRRASAADRLDISKDQRGSLGRTAVERGE
jgi:DNA-binding MarR family transcriptional regulator